MARFARDMNDKDMQERVQRSKDAADKARDTFGPKLGAKDITPESAKHLIGLIREAIGGERLLELADSASTQAGADKSLI